ncbi:MAG: hypothetical protein PHO66_00125 [Eubacteriales bacterium]|nr:hypothetical protein [Eubacteriales bacterium]
MKRVVVMLVAMMLCMVIIGCSPAQNQRTNSEPTQTAGNAVEATNAAGNTAKATDTDSDIVKATEPVDDMADAETISKAYEAYSGVKTEFLTKLAEALTQNENTVWGAMSLLPLVSVELDLVPITLLGQGKQSIAVGLAVMGASDIEYSENGGLHRVNYTDKDGGPCSLDVTYDAGADALVCTHTKDGNENIYAQYQKTIFGYAAQYYLVNEEGAATLYQLSLSAEDGMLGILKDASKPPALTGGEEADFPKACPQWYAITGQTVTALTSDGMDLSFEYNPTPAP